MKKFGGYLLFFGIGSILLNLMGREFSLLMWIDNWGIEAGWAIRGSFIVLGAILFIVGMLQEKAQDTALEEPEA